MSRMQGEMTLQQQEQQLRYQQQQQAAMAAQQQQQETGGPPKPFPWKAAAISGALLAAAGAAVFLQSRYHVSQPHQYLVRTGWLIDDVAVSKKGLQLPFQEARFVSMVPRNLNFRLKCLSKQYLPFNMPVTFTVKPRDPANIPVLESVKGNDVETESLTLFKRYVLQMDALSKDEFAETVLGVIHGETRVLAAQMAIDAVNDDRDAFRLTVTDNVQQILNQMGLQVVNANIAELIEDPRPGQMGYLEARERRKLSDAVQKSEIDVAEATRMGDIGKMEMEAQTRQRVALLQAETLRLENEQQALIAASQAELAEAQASSSRREEVAKIEASQAAQQRQQELQLQVEEARREQMRAAKQASVLTTAEVERSAAKVRAEGEADAIRAVALANRDKGMYEAETEEARLRAIAEGERARLEAQAEGTRMLVEACGPEALRDVLWVNNKIPQSLAVANARAVADMKPQIYSVSGDSAGAMLSRLMTSLSPAMDMLEKTGLMTSGKNTDGSDNSSSGSSGSGSVSSSSSSSSFKNSS